MPLTDRMNISVHPFLGSPRYPTTMSDNFLLGIEGPRRLHQFPHAIIEL